MSIRLTTPTPPGVLDEPAQDACKLMAHWVAAFIIALVLQSVGAVSCCREAVPAMLAPSGYRHNVGA